MKITLLLFLTTAAAQDVTPSSVAITWANVPPPAQATNWNRDIVICDCDLTANQCDASCSCDKDCCVDADCSNLNNMIINLWGYIRQTYTPFSLSSYLCSIRPLCAVLINSQAQGYYYNDVGTFTTNEAFEQIYEQGRYLNSLNYFDTLNPPLAKPSGSYLTSYLLDDPLRIAFTTQNLVGNFTLPTTSNSVCKDTEFPRVMRNTNTKCARYLSLNCPTTASTNLRGSGFDLNYYIKGFQFVADSKTGALLPSSSVTYNIYNLNSATGLLTTVSQNNPSTSFAGIPCGVGAVVAANYFFTYGFSADKLDPNTSNWILQSVHVDFTLQSVNSLFPTWDQLATIVPVAVPQSFSVNFVQAGATNIYSRSGNPGYVLGLPVVSGSKTTNGGLTAINSVPDPRFGITLAQDYYNSASKLIECPASTDKLNRSPVTFGENTAGGCTLWLKISDFNSAASCAALRTKISDVQSGFPSQIAYVGKFGNASVENIAADWIPITSKSVGSTADKSIPYTCSNILTNFDVQFLYTNYGSISNPQYAIVGARYSSTFGNMQWKCDQKTDCVDNTNDYSNTAFASSNVGTTQRPFMIRNSVTFVKVGTVGSSLYTPASPQIWATLPDDIWYPFFVS